jgi:hypothetical protein
MKINIFKFSFKIKIKIKGVIQVENGKVLGVIMMKQIGAKFLKKNKKELDILVKM